MKGVTPRLWSRSLLVLRGLTPRWRSSLPPRTRLAAPGLWSRSLLVLRGLTPRTRLAAPPGQSDAWDAMGGWELLFTVSLVVSVIFVTADDGASGATKAIVLALLGVCALAYVVLGRQVIKNDEYGERRAWWYAGLVIVAFVPATILVPAASFALFALCPQAFMLLRARAAVAFVLLLNLSPALRFLTTPGREPMDFVMFAGTAAITITFTLVFGPWIIRIITQSAERAELIKQLEDSRAEVARLSAERGALAERERLAGEIHDTLAQGFTSIVMLIQAAEAQSDPGRHLRLAVQTARENLAEARALVAALSPAPLDGSTLDEALRRLTARLAEETGVTADFKVGGVSRSIPPSGEVVLIRATQEGLANVRKHAAARSVTVSVAYGEADVTLTVADDGTGFVPHECSGFGLSAMRARVEQVGGTLDVDSTPAHGTTLNVRIPA